jgi:glyoxylase-like metal-dependent hydrolase (beta-lactamase superfamily II)
MAGTVHVHHLDCAHFTRNRIGGRPLACHVLLLELPRGSLALVDTGLGTADYAGSSRLGWLFPRLTGFDRKGARPAIQQVRDLGFAPTDVRHIVQTHLDLDHVGGLADFPQATVHVFASELAAARAPRWPVARFRYRPVMWAHRPAFQTYDEARGEPWMEFEAVRQLEGLPPEILLIPLAGHTVGQCGVAVESDRGWLLHAGDAYFDPREVHQAQYQCTPGLRVLQCVVTAKRGLRRYNQRRLRRLIADHPEIDVFSAHDPTGFQSRARVPSEPAPAP